MQGLLHGNRHRMGFGRLTNRGNEKYLNGLANYHIYTRPRLLRKQGRVLSVRDCFQFNAFSQTLSQLRCLVAVLLSHVTFIRDLIGYFLLWVNTGSSRLGNTPDTGKLRIFSSLHPSSALDGSCCCPCNGCPNLKGPTHGNIEWVFGRERKRKGECNRKRHVRSRGWRLPPLPMKIRLRHVGLQDITIIIVL